MSSKIAYEFIGGPGSGKDTQRNLLENYLKDKGFSVMSFDVGESFRKARNNNKCFDVLMKKIVDNGEFLPDAFAVNAVTSFALENFAKADHFLFSGVCRNALQTRLFLESMQVLGFESFYAINLDVSTEILKKRIQERTEGRADDRNEEIIDKRIGIHLSRMSKITEELERYKITTHVCIDGSKGIEEIHKSIIEKLGL